LLQVEIVSTSHSRVEAIYECCPEAYPNLTFNIAFKLKGIFYHDKLNTPGA
jgi:hypothetical protein